MDKYNKKDRMSSKKVIEKAIKEHDEDMKMTCTSCIYYDDYNNICKMRHTFLNGEDCKDYWD